MPGEVRVRGSRAYTPFRDAVLEDSVWARFVNVARRHGDHPAVLGDTSVWSSKQLVRKASAVGRALQKVDPESCEPVAMLLRHEMKMLPALLGAVKAGRPYVFLDSSLPPERLRFLIKDSGATLMVFDPKREALAVAIAGDSLGKLNLDEALKEQVTDVEHSASKPETPLCINYTSGTTGTPSGVVRSHRALLANIRNMTNLAKISSVDRMSLCISPASGAAAMDIFGALLNGASLAPFDVRSQGVPLLAECMVRHKITIFHSVPTLFRGLIKVMENGLRLPEVRFVLLGGEAVFRSDLEAFQRHFSDDCIFQNVLGMTEGAGILCSYLANQHTRLAGECVPVGYPVPGKTVKIVDPEGQEMPIGEAGEITVESALLSAGYLGQQTRTSERYLDMGRRGMKRLLTRDLGRIRPEDGALEWLGRMDAQLKVGGLRVSPAEVESVLLLDPAVREAVVTLAGRGKSAEQGRQTQLLAWIVPTEGMTVNAETLRHLLRSHLPPEAIPARFISLTQFPVLANGKVDRRALNLDHPAADVHVARALEIAPRHPMEQVVAESWERVLGRKVDSVYAHFFEMGGDSLAAVNLLASLSSHFGFELPGHALLHYPSIAELAERIPVWRTKLSSNRAFAESLTPLEVPAVVPLKLGGEATPLYILPGGQGRETEMLVFAQVLARLRQPRPAYGLRISALNDSFLEMNSLSDIARKMNQLCRESRPAGPWILVGECGAGLLAVEMARQLHEENPADAPTKVILLDVRTNVHLSEIGFKADHGLIPSHLARYYELLFSWEPKPFDFPIELITSEAFRGAAADDTLGWSRYCHAPITTRQVPGDHATYIRQHADHAAAAFEEALL